ncbi:hypothetical protein [Gracilimonas tropica]|uniref:hypothetical protein n=1 Tax=Gracilimonas tropica TaxID=454600 RepID=UPI00035C8873|nr:hypothetical protein [Gracilimonas tropica]
MHYIQHQYQGFKSSRWYQLDHQRYIKITLSVTNPDYCLQLIKGYGLNAAGDAPRAEKLKKMEFRGTVKAIEKLFERYIKEYVAKSQTFREQIALRPEPVKQLELASGGLR